MVGKLNLHFTRFGIFLITALLIAEMVGCGPISQNLEIRTWYDLDDVRDNLGGNHILMNDLDSITAGYAELAGPAANRGKGWQPIASWDSFTGNFDGQGYEIHDLFIDRSEEDINVGLFRWVGREGTIDDIGVVNVTIIGLSGAGALAGYSQGTVSNSYSTGSVTGNFWSYGVGGLVGRNRGTVSDSYSNTTVTGWLSVGGLVGSHSMDGILSDCYFTGSVTGDLGVGGLMGENDGIVSNSYYNYNEVLINSENIITTGALFDEDFDQWLTNDKSLNFTERLSIENGYYVVNNVSDFKQLLVFSQRVGQKFRLKNDLDLATEPNLYIPYFMGEFDGNGHKISNVTFNFDFVVNVGLFGYLTPAGEVTQLGVENVNISGARRVGGLVGWNYKGTVSKCYTTGNVRGSATVPTVVYEEYAGGLVGVNAGTVSNSYSTCSVAGLDSVGGLIGCTGGTVSSCYSTGSVTGVDYIGGLVGEKGMGMHVSNSFWDTETSGQATSDGGTGKNTTEMKDIDTFSVPGWDITTVINSSERNPSYIWNIVNGVTYPFLSWQPV